jgi:Family of unknown function (DUF6459)
MSTSTAVGSLAPVAGPAQRFPGAAPDPSTSSATMLPWRARRSARTEKVRVRAALTDRQRAEQEALEAQRTAARRAAREHLPSPAEVAKEIALALFEVEAGRRSAAQLERVFSPALWDVLEERVQRRGGSLPRSSDLLRVHYQELVPGLANTVAVVQRGPRVQPVAMRLDACSGRWLVTELRY